MFHSLLILLLSFSVNICPIPMSNPSVGPRDQTTMIQCHRNGKEDMIYEWGGLREEVDDEACIGFKEDLITMDAYISKMGFTVCDKNGNPVLLSKHAKLIELEKFRQLQKERKGKRELKNLRWDMKDGFVDGVEEGVKHSGWGILSKGIK